MEVMGSYLIETPNDTSGGRNMSFELLSVKIALKCDPWTSRRTDRTIDMLINKNNAKSRFFSRMRRAATAESILVKLCTSTF